jgi:hypothetical protein
MTMTKYSLENALDGETISGLSIYTLDDLPLEYYRDLFVETVKKDYDKAELLLDELLQLDAVGSFIGTPESQTLEFAVFGLILMDRLIQNRLANEDGWDSMFLYDQMLECQEYIRFPSQQHILRQTAKKAADARHKEHRDMKKQVIDYYETHKTEFRSIDHAADTIVNKVKLVPVKFRTVQTWISQHKKENVQSPSKP